MYIKTELNNAELKMSKISSKKELIEEIKTLANTLSDDIKNEYNITNHQIACHYLSKNSQTININEQNIIKLQNIFENTEQILNKLTTENPIEIEANDYPWYCFYIDLDENSKLKIEATSKLKIKETFDLDVDPVWDTLIRWSPASKTDEF